MKGLLVFLMSVLLSFNSGRAQTPGFILEVIKAGIVKVIKAVDLKIQRLQTETIWLQNAQKVVENTLSKLRLQEIAEWSEKQRVLYADYFDELYRVKNWIVMYQRIRDVTAKQIAIINEYKRAWSLFRNDQHFTASQLGEMQNFYAWLIDESVKNIEQIRLMITAYSLQMSDASRLEIIERVADRIDKNYADLVAFNDRNMKISIEAGRSLDEIEAIKLYYGIE